MESLPSDVRENLDTVLVQLSLLTDEQRMAALIIILDTICEHCGRLQVQGERRCQCWNDE